MNKNAVSTGGCLCSAVRYEVHGPLRAVINCHCEQCRRSSGHHVAATATDPKNLVFLKQDGLRWYRSSDTAQRGFCQICGSSLFWRPDSGDRISISAGTLDSPTGLRTVAHIFVESAGDYYSIDDDIEQHNGGDYPLAIPQS